MSPSPDVLHVRVYVQCYKVCCAGSFPRLASEGHALLRSLHLDNYGAFAQMFVAEMLRAAATGEAFLEDKISSLADRDLSRFQQLNQRMSVGAQIARQVVQLC